MSKLSLEDKVNYLLAYIFEGREINKLFYSLELNPTEVEKVYDIMEEFMENQNYTYADVENKFKTELNINYQILKSIFNSFYEQGEYFEVLKNYINTNFKAFGNISSEYKGTLENLLDLNKKKLI